MLMNEFVIELSILVSIFTEEMEKYLSKLLIVTRQINETVRNKPQLPLALARAFRPQLGQPVLSKARHAALACLCWDFGGQKSGFLISEPLFGSRIYCQKW